MPEKYDIFSEYDKKAIRNFAKKCLKLKNTLLVGTNLLTPYNYHREKDKFFRSKTYNPQFRYKKWMRKHIVRDIEDTRKILMTLQLPEELSKHFSRYLRGIELVSQTSDAIGKDHFPKSTQKLFAISVNSAHKILQSLPTVTFQKEEANTLHNAEEIAQIFHDYLENYHELYGYNIYLDTFNDHTIRVGERSLIIGSRVKRTTSNVKRLIVHEIESHMLQRYNSKISRNPLVKLVRAGDQEMFSEGLAVFNEIYTGTITQKAYNMYFYRLKAVEMLHCSFREIYSYLSNYVTPNQAFIITTRVKRGMKDTKQPGGFPKDASYLLGYNKIRQYVREGGTLPFLYVVRDPEYGKTLLKYDLLTKAEYVLPKFLKKQPMGEQLRNELMIH